MKLKISPEKIKSIQRIAVYSLVLVFLLLLTLQALIGWPIDTGTYPVLTEEEKAIATEQSKCNIAVIPIRGDIISYINANYYDINRDSPPPATADPDTVAKTLQTAEANNKIRGILTIIDSYGGDSFAGDLIMKEIKRSELPTASLIRSAGASAGYLIATAGDTIIASPWSDVGSIGVTMSYVQNVEQNKKDGLDYVSLSAGKYKDAGDPNRILTSEERAIAMRDINTLHRLFIKEVSENRKLPVNAVTKLADGSTMLGELALKNKLIDQLGDQETARGWFARKLNISADEVVFCE